MAGTNNPQQPGTTGGQTPGMAGKTPGMPGQTPASRPNQNREEGKKSGRPQDDRDPNSPTRGTQRPGEPTNANQVTMKNDEDTDQGDSEEGNAKMNPSKPGQQPR